MKEIKIAAIQAKAELCSSEDAFSLKVNRLVQTAVLNGADIIVFPEDISLWISWASESPRVLKIRNNESVSSLSVQSTLERIVDWLLLRLKLNWFGEWISQSRITNILQRVFSESSLSHDAVIIAGSEYIKKASGIYNVSRVYSGGKLIGESTKKHLVPVEESWGIKAGDFSDIIVYNDIRFGVCICYDLNYEDVCKELSDQGIDFIAAPSAGYRPYLGYPFSEKDMPQIQRAKENGVHIVRPYQCGVIGPLIAFEGHTSIVDPSGTIVAKSSRIDAEEIVYYTIKTV